MTSHAPSIEALFVLSRGLGSTDDAASQEEQLQKILFFHPEDTPLSRQLQTTNMCEGIIDFAARFSDNEDLDTVVMKDTTYGIKRCEEDLWLVVVVSNDSDVEGTKGVSELGLQRLLTQAYQTYFMQHGAVQSDLNGSDGNGGEIIAKAKALRKAIRKLNRKLSEIEDDQLHADEDAPLEQIEAMAQHKRDVLQERRSLEEQLEDVLVHSPLVRLRRRWQALMRWYLQAQDFANISSLHALSGVHYHTLDASGFRKVSRTVFNLKEQTRSLGLKACTILCDGAVIWNELDEVTLLALYEFIQLNEGMKNNSSGAKQSGRTKQKSMSQRFRSEFGTQQQQDRLATLPEMDGNGYESFGAGRRPSDDSEGWKSEANSASKARRLESEKKAKAADARDERAATGFIGNGWTVLDDKFSQLRSLADVQTAVFSEYCVGTQGIWCPRIYSASSDASGLIGAESSPLAFEVSRGLLGRLILYKLGSFLFILLVDEAVLSEQKQPASPAAASPSAVDSPAPIGSPRLTREAGVTVRSVQPICNSIRSSLGAALSDLQDIIQADNVGSDAQAGMKLVYLNRCNSTFRIMDGAGNGMNATQFPLQASQLAKHIPDHFVTSIGDAMECFAQRNSTETHYSYCVRASSGDWLFARSQGGRQLFTLVSDQSFFQEAYDSMMNTSRRVLRGVMF